MHEHSEQAPVRIAPAPNGRSAPASENGQATMSYACTSCTRYDNNEYDSCASRDLTLTLVVLQEKGEVRQADADMYQLPQGQTRVYISSASAAEAKKKVERRRQRKTRSIRAHSAPTWLTTTGCRHITGQRRDNAGTNISSLQ